MKDQSEGKKNLSILADAGYPYALTTQFYINWDTETLLLEKSGYCRSLTKKLKSCGVLLAGDLPKPIFPESKRKAFMSWLTEGGVLVYFTGWKDFEFIRKESDLFGVRIGKPIIQDFVSEIQFVHEDWKKRFDGVPATRYVTDSEPVSCECLAVTEQGKPFLIRKSQGRGWVYLFLGPINYPAGFDWLYWPHLISLFREIIGNRCSAGSLDVPSEIISYSEIHSNIALKEYDKALYQLSSLKVSKLQNRILACEMTQLSRFVSLKLDDIVGVLQSLRTVVEIIQDIPPANQTYDYCEEQQGWYEMKHFRDCVNLLNSNTETYANKGINALERYIYDSNTFLPLRDARYLERAKDTITAYKWIVAFGNPFSDVSQSLFYLDEISQAFRNSNQTLFLNPQSQFFGLVSSIVNQLVPLRFPSPDAVYVEDPLERINHLLAILEKLNLSYIKIDDIANFREFSRQLANGDDFDAWPFAIKLENPLLQSLCGGVLNLRSKLRQNPLVLFPPFNKNRLLRDTTIDAINRLVNFRNEGNPIRSRLLFLASEETHKVESSIKISSFDILKSGGVEEIAKYSAICDLIVFSEKGKSIGAVTFKGKKRRTYSQFVSDRDLSIQKLSKELRGCAISVNSSLRAASIHYNGQLRARLKGSGWEAPKSSPVSQIIQDEKARSLLMYLITRVLNILDSNEDFHGGSILISKDAIRYAKLGKSMESNLDTLTEGAFAGFLGIDGGILVSYEGDPKVVATGCVLPAKPESIMRIVEKNPWVGVRGTRHKHCIGFTEENADVFVLIFSEDGSATLAVQGRAVPLW